MKNRKQLEIITEDDGYLIVDVNQSLSVWEMHGGNFCLDTAGFVQITREEMRHLGRLMVEMADAADARGVLPVPFEETDEEEFTGAPI